MASSDNNSISYIPNTWYSNDKINEDNSNHDCMDLCYDGHLFKSPTKLNIINDNILNNHRQMLRDEEISIDTYTKYVSMLFELTALDKKKKKTQNDDEEISTASEYDSDESELDEFTE